MPTGPCAVEGRAYGGNPGIGPHGLGDHAGLSSCRLALHGLTGCPCLVGWRQQDQCVSICLVDGPFTTPTSPGPTSALDRSRTGDDPHARAGDEDTVAAPPPDSLGVSGDETNLGNADQDARSVVLDVPAQGHVPGLDPGDASDSDPLRLTSYPCRRPACLLAGSALGQSPIAAGPRRSSSVEDQTV